ncbi:MAG: hypothetical protein IKR02_03215, partial [Firmicutes bacterium]|nr:hypothetical protein [Bacillota bacterium]
FASGYVKAAIVFEKEQRKIDFVLKRKFICVIMALLKKEKKTRVQGTRVFLCKKSKGGID